MGAVMKLIEVIRDLDTLDDEGTIYAAQPWTANSEAVVAREPGAGGLPSEAKRLALKYFLEVSVARDFLKGWEENIGAHPTLQQECARIIKYASTDA
jgi:hypothetical protein